MSGVLFRIFAKNGMPRYRRRHFARRLSTMMAQPRFIAMTFLSGALVGAWITLGVERFL